VHQAFGQPPSGEKWATPAGLWRLGRVGVGNGLAEYRGLHPFRYERLVKSVQLSTEIRELRPRYRVCRFTPSPLGAGYNDGRKSGHFLPPPPRSDAGV
jgi:hypothetical protein